MWRCYARPAKRTQKHMEQQQSHIDLPTVGQPVARQSGGSGLYLTVVRHRHIWQIVIWGQQIYDTLIRELSLQMMVH